MANRVGTTSKGAEPGWAIVSVRWLLGVQCLLSGLNWWVKMLPFPNLHDPVGGPVKHAILHAMIATGWMFTACKVIEVLTGLALVLNRYAVLMLVVAFPVLLMTYLLDTIPFGYAIVHAFQGVETGHNLWAAFLDMVYWGGCVVLMQAYLMFDWFGHYRPLFAPRPGEAAMLGPLDIRNRTTMVALRWAAIVIGGSSTLWMIGMVDKWLIPWSSLAVLAPSK